jgi:FkbH-like protein
MLLELPWLAPPTEAERDALRQLDLNDGMTTIIRLAGLAQRRWSDSEQGAIGRKLRKFLEATPPGWQDDVRRVGLSPLTMLMLCSGTAAHLVEPLMAGALAQGIVLQCEVVEYQEPEAWLAGNVTRLAAAPPDAVLLSLDRHSLRLHAAIGDSAAADACVQAALDRLAVLAGKLGAASQVIIENLPLSPDDPQASIDAWLPGSPRHLTALFNQRLAASVAAHPYLLFDVAGLADLVGQSAWSPGRYGYTAKMPFSPACIPLYAQRLATLLAALRGKSRRVLVLDLDNTLWSGVVGDDGVDGLVLGGNSAVGKAHAAIQKMALQYRERGIMLCVASKNTREIALDAFRRHPEMVLRESDITLFEINWSSKADSIRAMARALNLGLESFVFLDDNPAERKQVRDTLPGVAVPELPRDPSAWLPVIQGAAYFEQTSLSAEDLQRADYYRDNAERTALQEQAGDEGEFLKSLKMVMAVAPFDSMGRKRIAQLIAKSNQFNLTTRRYSESQIAEFENDPQVETLQMRLEDIFGDNGMISVILCRKGKPAWEIDTWLMSCRVLGRGVEQAALNLIADRARRAGASELRGIYIPTAKNGIVRDHYAKLGFRETHQTQDGETSWVLALGDFAPPDTDIEIREAAPP